MPGLSNLTTFPDASLLIVVCTSAIIWLLERNLNCAWPKVRGGTKNFLQRARFFIPALCRCSPLSGLVGVWRKLGSQLGLRCSKLLHFCLKRRSPRHV